MESTVQLFCSGDWDPQTVPQGTECLEPLLEAAKTHLPSRPDRCFTGEEELSITGHEPIRCQGSTVSLRNCYIGHRKNRSIRNEYEFESNEQQMLLKKRSITQLYRLID